MNKNKKNISYGRQWIDSHDITAVSLALKADLLTGGKSVQTFEENIATYCNAKYAVAVSSGTAGLHIAYMAAGLMSDENIITTPITFAATSNAALYLGAKVKFADIDINTALIDINNIEQLIDDKTRIITPVHYAGLAVDMKQLYNLAKKYNLIIVEDACHALGATYGDNLVGDSKYSDMTVFSFHPVKHITTAEGGMVTTNNEKLYNKLKLLRSHGIEKENFINTPQNPTYTEMQYLGYNYRLTDVASALGISQLKKIDKFLSRRLSIAEYYNEAFKDNSKITLLQNPNNFFHAYHLFPILLQNKTERDKLYYKLLADNIATQIHYTPVYMHPYYRTHGYEEIKCINAEEYYDRTLSIPIYPLMSDDDIKLVAISVLEGVK